MSEFWSRLRETVTAKYFEGVDLPIPTGINYQEDQETFCQWWEDLPEVGTMMPVSEEELAHLRVAQEAFASIIRRGQSHSGLDRELWVVLNGRNPTYLTKPTRDELLSQVAKTYKICDYLLSAEDVMVFARGGEGQALDDLSAIRHHFSPFFSKEELNF